jgi:hypothetical protein
METKKSERIFWTVLSPAHPSYTALTGPETAICERPRAGDRKSDKVGGRARRMHSRLAEHLADRESRGSSLRSQNEEVRSDRSDRLRLDQEMDHKSRQRP